MKDSILVVTSSVDVSVDPVMDILYEMGERPFRLNTDTFPRETGIRLNFDGKRLSGRVSTQSGSLDLQQIKSCWYRRSDRSKGLDEFPEGYTEFIKSESKAALWSLYTNLDAFWVNDPLIGSKLLEGNKLYQLRVASRIGLVVPSTILTNEPEELLGFCVDSGGRIAVKMTGGKIFVNAKEDEILALYTQ